MLQRDMVAHLVWEGRLLDGRTEGAGDMLCLGAHSLLQQWRQPGLLTQQLPSKTLQAGHDLQHCREVLWVVLLPGRQTLPSARCH